MSGVVWKHLCRSGVIGIKSYTQGLITHAPLSPWTIIPPLFLFFSLPHFFSFLLFFFPLPFCLSYFFPTLFLVFVFVCVSSYVCVRIVLATLFSYGNNNKTQSARVQSITQPPNRAVYRMSTLSFMLFLLANTQFNYWTHTWGYCWRPMSIDRSRCMRRSYCASFALPPSSRSPSTWTAPPSIVQGADLIMHLEQGADLIMHLQQSILMCLRFWVVMYLRPSSSTYRCSTLYFVNWCVVWFISR